MNKQLFTVPVQFSNMKSRVDRTWRLEFDTSELGKDATILTELLHEQGWLLFSPNDDITEKDIPEVNAESSEGKSPSARLRAVLYVFWTQKGKPGTWDQFYLQHMNRLIEGIKDNLEPEL